MKDKIVNEHISTNYETYIKIVMSGNHYKSSNIKENLYDIVNDVLVEILSMDMDLLYNKLITKSNTTSKNGLNNMLDGLIIYMINLNLWSPTSRYYKKYHNKGLDLEMDKFEKIEETEPDKSFIYSELEEIINNLDLKYDHKKLIFKEKFDIDGDFKDQKTYRFLSKKYNIPISSLRSIVIEIQKEIKNNFKKNEL